MPHMLSDFKDKLDFNNVVKILTFIILLCSAISNNLVGELEFL